MWALIWGIFLFDLFHAVRVAVLHSKNVQQLFDFRQKNDRPTYAKRLREFVKISAYSLEHFQKKVMNGQKKFRTSQFNSSDILNGHSITGRNDPKVTSKWSQNDLLRSKYIQINNQQKKWSRKVYQSTCLCWSSDLTASNRVVKWSYRGSKWRFTVKID